MQANSLIHYCFGWTRIFKRLCVRKSKVLVNIAHLKSVITAQGLLTRYAVRS
jgi:hypothetical protein